VGGYCGSANLLESGNFLLDPAKLADEGRFRLARHFGRVSPPHRTPYSFYWEGFEDEAFGRRPCDERQKILEDDARKSMQLNGGFFRVL